MHLYFSGAAFTSLKLSCCLYFFKAALHAITPCMHKYTSDKYLEVLIFIAVFATACVVNTMSQLPLSTFPQDWTLCWLTH